VEVFDSKCRILILCLYEALLLGRDFLYKYN